MRFEQPGKPPKGLQPDMLEFLDAHYRKGNDMFQATTAVHDRFASLTRTQARAVLYYWMRTYRVRHPKSRFVFKQLRQPKGTTN